MGSGRVYVMHNEWLRNPNNGNTPYKIGITKGSASNRYSGFKLLMPGDFTPDFEYEFSDNYDKVEKALHNMLDKSRIKGEWFEINDSVLTGIRSTCELAGGKLITGTVGTTTVGTKPKEIPPVAITWTREMWIEKSKCTVETADSLKELVLGVGVFKNLDLRYKVGYIAIVSSDPSKRPTASGANVCFFLENRKDGENKSSLSFRVNTKQRGELIRLLEENSISYKTPNRGDKKVRISIDKQFIEKHKEVLIKITKFVKAWLR